MIAPRREILHLPRKEAMTAGAVAARFDLTKPGMSHHFAVRKDAGLVSSRRPGSILTCRPSCPSIGMPAAAPARSGG